MKQTPRGFIAQVFLLGIALLLVGGAYLYQTGKELSIYSFFPSFPRNATTTESKATDSKTTQTVKSTKSTTSSSRSSNVEPATQPSAWNTYTFSSGGYVVSYPGDLSIAEVSGNPVFTFPQNYLGSSLTRAAISFEIRVNKNRLSGEGDDKAVLGQPAHSVTIEKTKWFETDITRGLVRTITVSDATDADPGMHISHLSLTGTTVAALKGTEAEKIITVFKSMITTYGSEDPLTFTVSGPSSILADRESTWKVAVLGTEGDEYTYKVCWDDEECVVPQGANRTKVTNESFRHTYDDGGTYTITFLVTNGKGQWYEKKVKVSVTSD